MASGTMVSLEEYLSTSYESDLEFVDGELLDRYAGDVDHSCLQGVTREPTIELPLGELFKELDEEVNSD